MEIKEKSNSKQLNISEKKRMTPKEIYEEFRELSMIILAFFMNL